MNLTAMLDTDSLAELVRLQGFSALLDPNIAQALAEGGKLLVSSAQENTWEVFENPTGQLAESIYFYVASPQEVQVVVGVPYGRRQELGGGDKLDALGRRMTNPAKPYLLPAIEEHEQDMQDLLAYAVDAALGRSSYGS